MRFAILAVVIMLLVGGCGHNADINNVKKKVVTPIWSDSDLPEGGVTATVYEHEVNADPPYYRGSKPLMFKQAERPRMGTIYDDLHVYYIDFGAFRNVYIYNGGSVLEGAITVKDGKRIAEARLSYYVIQGKPYCKQGIRAEEFHYDSGGELIFYCKDEIDSDTGFKTKETDAAGSKQEEYYFLWPARPG